MSASSLLAAAPLAADAYALTSGRAWSLVAGALAVAGVVIGGLALARARRHGAGRGVGAVVTGLAGAVVGGLVVALADGGPGSGSGIVGGVLALAVGLAAAALGALAVARSRRAV